MERAIGRTRKQPTCDVLRATCDDVLRATCYVRRRARDHVRRRYSARSTATGSRRAARHAGTPDASTATAMTDAATTP